MATPLHLSGSEYLASFQPTRVLLFGLSGDERALLSLVVQDLQLDFLHVDALDEATARLRDAEFTVVVIGSSFKESQRIEFAVSLRRATLPRKTPILLLDLSNHDADQVEALFSLGAVECCDLPLSRNNVRGKLRGLAALSHHLGQSELWFRDMVDAVQDYAIFLLDPTGRVVTWNKGAERIKQYRAHEIIGQHFSVFYPEDVVRNRWPEHELKVASVDGRFEDEGWRIRKDGTTFWANVVITAIIDQHGNLQGFTKVTRDLTSRKQAEENFRQLAEENIARRVALGERERLQATLASIADGVVSTDREGFVTFLNPVAERLTGWKADDAIGKKLEEVVQMTDENDGISCENLVLQALRLRAATSLSHRAMLISKLGRACPVESTASPIYASDHALVGCVLTFTDITRRVQAQLEREARLAVTHALTVASAVSEGVAGVLGAVCERLQWDAGVLWVVSDDGEGLRCHTSRLRSGVKADGFVATSLNRRFAKGEGLPGRVWETRTPIWLSDVATDETFLRAADGLQSAYGCPVVVGDRFLGVIEFFARKADTTDHILLELMDAVASAIGQLLQREHAEEALREQTANAEILLRIGTILSQQLELQPLVQTVTDESTALCGAQFGAFFYNEMDDRGETYTLYTVSGVPRHHFEQFPMPRNTALFAPTFHGQGVVRLADVTKDERYGKSSPYFGMPKGHMPVKSYLAVPVVSRTGEVLGGLFFGHAQPDVFTPQHERLLVGIAGQAAIAIDNARLHQRTQAVADRLSIAITAAELGDWQWDAESDRVIFSQRAAEVFGIPSGPYMTWTEMQGLLHSADVQRVSQEIQRVIAERVLYNIEYRIVRRDGSVVWVEALGRAVYDDAGKSTGMYGVVKDVTERKRLEESLKASEARIRGLMDQAPFSVQILSPRGETIRVNRAWEELWGVTVEHVRDYNILEDTQLEANGVLHLIQKAFAGEASFIPPIKYDPNQTLPGRSRHNEPTRFVGAVVFPLKDEAGVIQEVVIVHDDVTAQKHAESALQASEERLRLALDAGQMGVWDWNIRTGELKWSDRLEPLHGLKPGTFGGTFEHFTELIHPDDRAAVLSAISEALRTCGDFYVEFRNLREDGGVNWISGSGKVFLGDDGQPLRMIGVGFDVTNRKRAVKTAQFLADASAELAVLVDFESTLQKVASLAVPFFADWATVDVIDENGNLERVAVAHINPAKIELAHKIHSRFPPDPSAPTGVWNILRTGQVELVPVITDEMLVASIKDSELLDIVRDLGLKSYLGVPLTVRGKTLGVLTFIVAESNYIYDQTDLVVAKDLADRAAIAVENSQLYKELKDADRRKDEFLAVLAHELRNPLAPIRNGLQILRLMDNENSVAAEARLMMERQLAHMIRLVDDLLDVSRITRNKLELRKERVQLATVIRTAIETSRPLIEQFGHALSVSLPPITSYVEADAVRLAQVFSNLLNNSAKYTPAGGRIDLTAEQTENEVCVRIKDNGVGIPPDSLPFIFDMFSQVDRNMEKAQGGLGIGLTLVRRLTEMHGGTVVAKSDGCGRGSEFTVCLPLIDNFGSKALQPTDRKLDVPCFKKRILVVDDNCDSASSLGLVLKLLGNEVRTAGDGHAAIEMAMSYRPEVIFLDIGLPKLNGYEVCRRIRAFDWADKIMIVALTGWGQDADRLRSTDAGFDKHLVKPVDFAALVELLGKPK